MRKRLIVEDEVKQLNDFQKILLLNKGKLDPDDVEFNTNDDRDISDIIEVTKHGILFNFDDLEQFLKFFFPETYAEGGDGEYDAMNYDRMYYNSYDFYDNCSDTAYDDWKEGYTLGYFCDTATRKLKTLVNLLDPSLSKHFSEKNGKMSIDDSEGVITQLLDEFFKNLQDEVSDIICRGKEDAVSGEASKLMEDTFCNGLRRFGIENWGGKAGCFRTYFISWGNLVRFFTEKGEFDELALDTMFGSLERNFKDHPSTYYEIEHNVWDNDAFENYACDRLVNLMDEYIEKANEDFNPEYIESIGKLSKLGIFGKKLIPGTKETYIKVNSVDPETLQVKYQVGKGSWLYDPKYGIAPVDEVISIATQPGLFDPKEFRVNPTRNQR